jgi:hypothetical protein
MPPGCAAGEQITGCFTDVNFIHPDCAQIAELSGFATQVSAVGASDDGDIFFDLCPDANSMRVDPFGGEPFSGPFQELRATGNFHLTDASVVGRMHIEVQGCRLFLGHYQVPESPTPLEAMPANGDSVSVAGDWVFDHGHSGWAEIHEARAIAVVRPVTNNISYVLLNAFFVDGSRQQDALHLDVRVPRPAALAGASLTCELAAAVPPGCPPKPGVQFTKIAATSQPNVDHGFCTVELQRGTNTPPLPFGCNPADGCAGVSSLQTGCNNIFFAGAIKATWSTGRATMMIRIPR